jgi:hypothetical protein
MPPLPTLDHEPRAGQGEQSKSMHGTDRRAGVQGKGVVKPAPLPDLDSLQACSTRPMTHDRYRYGPALR